MTKHNLYIIAGCNGAGKTTASFTILPEILGCRNFVNADEIARGLSPFNPSAVSVQAGRLMLHRIEELLIAGEDFALETTLATRSYVNLVNRARKAGYKVYLMYFWIESVEQARERVAQRVREGGHSIDNKIIERRYVRGITNLLTLYMPICDYVMVLNNTMAPACIIAEKSSRSAEIIVHNTDMWNKLLKSL
mgnify:CR=1 FL=1